MPGSRNASLCRQLLLGSILAADATRARANFFWPPALYYYGFAVWWAVPAGLAVEYVILFAFLRLQASHLLKVVVLANLASAIVGFLVTWPAVFWGSGIDLLVKGGSHGIVATVALMFVVNVAIEYFVAVSWLNVPCRISSIVGFTIANLASHIVLVMAGFSQLRM